MKRNLLTLLACSGSLACAVLISNAAQALIPAKPMGGAIPQFDTSATINSAVSQEEAPRISTQAVDPRIKQLAQSTFGCTCANCISATQQMVQQGVLSL